LISCSAQPAASRLIGKWGSGSAYNAEFELARDGKSFVYIGPSGKYAATLIHGDTMLVDGPLGKLSFVYSKESDTLTSYGVEFKRVK